MAGFPSGSAAGGVTVPTGSFDALPMYLAPSPSGDKTGATDTTALQNLLDTMLSQTNGGNLKFQDSGDYYVTGLKVDLSGTMCTLTTALSSGVAYTSLAVTATTVPINSGDQLNLGYGGDYPVASAAAPIGSTTIPVTSFTTSNAYPIGTTVADVDAMIRDGYGPKIVISGAARIWNVASISSKSTATFYVESGNGGSITAGWQIGTNYFGVMSGLELIGNATGGPGIYLSGMQQADILGLIAHDFTSTTSPAAGQYFGTAIFLDGCANINIYGPVFQYNHDGLTMGGRWANANNVYGGWLANNTEYGLNASLGGSGTGNNLFGTILQTNGTGANVDSTNFHGCWVERNTTYGIRTGGLCNLSDVTFSGNGTDIVFLGNGDRIIRPVWRAPASIDVHSGGNNYDIQFEGEKKTGYLSLTSFTDTTSGAGYSIRNCGDINPVGSVTVAVPASGTAVAAAPYDRWFYVTSADATTTIAVQGGITTAAIPSGSTLPVFVPANKTLTPTYSTTAPTWVVQGL